MRRMVLLLMAMGLSIVLASGVALAATFNGTAGNDSKAGTTSADNMYGLDGDDTLNGRAGNDLRTYAVGGRR